MGLQYATSYYAILIKILSQISLITKYGFIKSLNMLTQNVRGLDNAKKQRIIFNHFRKQKSHIFSIQETHFSAN